MSADGSDYEYENAIEAVLDAWRIEGKNPEYHREQKQALSRRWPSLHRALAELDRVAPAPVEPSRDHAGLSMPCGPCAGPCTIDREDAS